MSSDSELSIQAYRLFLSLITISLTLWCKSVQIQGGNIRHYHNYILTRAKSYSQTKLDWVREGQGRLKRQTIEKGLLRETESVQKQIAALLKCDVYTSTFTVSHYLCLHVPQLLTNDPENEITLTAFRLLTMDLLILYHVMNEGTINVLGKKLFERTPPQRVILSISRALLRNVQVRCRKSASHIQNL